MSPVKVAHCAELACTAHVSPARIRQIMNLLMLAPDIQEAILFLPRVERGRDPIRLQQLQPIARAGLGEAATDVGTLGQSVIGLARNAVNLGDTAANPGRFDDTMESTMGSTQVTKVQFVRGAKDERPAVIHYQPGASMRSGEPSSGSTNELDSWRPANFSFKPDPVINV